MVTRAARAAGASQGGSQAGRRQVGAEALDRATLVRVAADVADRDGWADLTLSQVAREVDRHVTSLYAHVAGLDDLRREVTLLALGELSDAVWRAALGHVHDEALESIATVLRRYCEQHPGRTAAIMRTSHAGDPDLVRAAERLAEPTRATLRSFGLDERQVVHAHRVFSATVTGFVQAERNGLYASGGADETFRAALDVFVVALGSGRWPGPVGHPGTTLP